MHGSQTVSPFREGAHVSVIKSSGAAPAPATTAREVNPGTAEIPNRVDSRSALDLFVTGAIPLRSSEGAALLSDLPPQHVAELTQLMSHQQVPEAAYRGGVWTATVLLNALRLPTAAALEQFTLPTNGYCFNYESQSSVAQKLEGVVTSSAPGSTLNQLGKLFRKAGANATVVHVDPSRLEVEEEAFRGIALAAIQDRSWHVMVNIQGVDGKGYHSPVAAYDEKTDRFLVYSLAPPTAEPRWVETRELDLRPPGQWRHPRLHRGHRQGARHASLQLGGRVCLDRIGGECAPPGLLSAQAPAQLGGTDGLLSGAGERGLLWHRGSRFDRQ